MKFFDYIFYVMYMYYYRRKIEDYFSRAVLNVTILYVFLFLSLLIIVRGFFVEISDELVKTLKIYYLIFVVGGALLFNHLRYKKVRDKDNFENYHQKWGTDDPKIWKRRGWFVVSVFLFILIVLPYIFIVVTNRFGIYK